MVNLNIISCQTSFDVSHCRHKNQSVVVSLTQYGRFIMSFTFESIHLYRDNKILNLFNYSLPRWNDMARVVGDGSFSEDRWCQSEMHSSYRV